jgi:two-component system NarL family sensor kinase
VIEDVRNYVFGLRPALLADHDLAAALEQLALGFQEVSHVVTVIDVDGAVAARLARCAPDLVQLTREALANVQRHARATTCRVSLKRAGDGALLTIDDDGCGFPAATTAAAGHGLRNLAERSRALGGRLETTSGESGTTLTVHLPLDP